jgi:hypothetical protein
MSRKAAITPEDFMRAVRRLNTLTNGPIAQFLGVGRTTVWDFKQKNPETVQEAKDYLASFDEFNVTATKMTWDIFQTMPKIREWKDAMERRMVSPNKQHAWMRSFYNVCIHLKRVPGKITVEECAKLVVEQRNRYYADEPQIKGIAYSTIRESVRGFFMSVHNVSGMHLTNLGVGKEALKGSGKFSRQAVPAPVRSKYEAILIDLMKATEDIKYFEALGNSIFCYATATRISASLAFSFKLHQYNLQKDKWMFEIWDKGSRGKKLRWEKIIMGSLLKKFKWYCSKRFDIPEDELEMRLPHATDYLFPAFVNEKGQVQDAKIRDIVRPTLIEAGIPYKEFPPTHIWRHTFAQDFLKASNWNYELTASLGGWKNTLILKGHYGGMGEQARERGLLVAMGLEIPEETHQLEW